jgi:uncharacterized DUF497 family protein
MWSRAAGSSSFEDKRQVSVRDVGRAPRPDGQSRLRPISPLRGVAALLYIRPLYRRLAPCNDYRDASLADRGLHLGPSGRHYLPEFEWDEANEQKLLDRHDVTAREAEECFANAHSKKRDGDAMLMLGMTDDGRMLSLVYERMSGAVRVYSAREMTARERTVYHRSAR